MPSIFNNHDSSNNYLPFQVVILISWLIAFSGVVFDLTKSFHAYDFLSRFTNLVIISCLFFVFSMYRCFKSEKYSSTFIIITVIGFLFIILRTPFLPFTAEVKYLIAENVGLGTWFIPIVGIVSMAPIFWKAYFKSISKQIICGYFITSILLFFHWVEYIQVSRYVTALLYGLGLYLILIEHYKISLKLSILSRVGFLIWLFAAFSIGRREDILYCLWCLVVLFLFKKKTFFYAGSVFIVIGISLLLTQILFSPETLYKRSLTLLPTEISDYTIKFIEEEMFVDTRKGLYADFLDDLKNEWLIGKGGAGKYSTPNFAPRYEEFGGRNIIEIGFLQIILRGGFLYLILFLSIAVYAIYLGLKVSNNSFTKILSLLILGHLLLMLSARIPAIDGNWFLLWIMIGACLSNKIRILDDNRILRMLFTNPHPRIVN